MWEKITLRVLETITTEVARQGHAIPGTSCVLGLGGFTLELRSCLRLIAAVVIVVLCSTNNYGQTRFWDTTAGSGNGVGGSGTWGTTFSTTASGSASLTTAGSTDTVSFQGTAGTVTLNASQTVSSSTFNVTNYTLTTNNTTFRTLGGSIFLANNVNLNISPFLNGALTIGSVTGGTSGSGLSIGGSHTAVGDTTRINLGSGSTIAASAPITISTSGTDGIAGFVASSGTASIAAPITNNSGVRTMLGATSGNTLNVNGTISGSQGLRFSAGSSGGAGIVNINAASNYSGPTEFNGASPNGVVRLGVTNGLSTSSDLVMGFSSGNGQVFDLFGFDQQVASLSSNSGGTGLIRNNGTGAGNNVLSIVGSASTSFGLVISDGTTRTTGLTLGVGNTGSLVLTGVNTFSGGTVVSGGTLALSGSGTTGSATGAITVNGGTLNFGGLTRTVGAVTLGGGTISNGTITGTSYTSTGGTVSANLAGTGVAFTNSSGTTTLSGANTYTGATNVNAGTLTVNGSLASGSTVTVANNATLNGIGTVSGTINSSGTLSGSGTYGGTTVNSGGLLTGTGTYGATTISSGGTLAPGNSPGNTNHASLTLDTGSNFVWDLAENSITNGGVDFDTITVAGNLSIGNIASTLTFGTNVNWNSSFWTTNKTWTVFTSNNLVSFGTIGVTIVDNAGLGNGNYSPGLGSFAWMANGNNVDLVFTAVPEPTSIIFGSIAAAAGGFGAWKRRRRSLKSEVGNVKEEDMLSA